MHLDKQKTIHGDFVNHQTLFFKTKQASRCTEKNSLNIWVSSKSHQQQINIFHISLCEAPMYFISCMASTSVGQTETRIAHNSLSPAGVWRRFAHSSPSLRVLLQCSSATSWRMRSLVVCERKVQGVEGGNSKEDRGSGR